MDFWEIYQNARASDDFGRQKLYLRARDRIHVSLPAVAMRGTGLDMNYGVSAAYSEGKRYVLAKNITFDLLVSFYDVNSSRALLFRATFPPNKKALARISSWLSGLKRPNLEMRVIGLQSGDTTMLDSIEKLHGLTKCNLQEADLFGRNARHVAFDLKVGMPLDLLTLDRIFRPEELVNGLSLEGFGRQRSELAFV